MSRQINLTYLLIAKFRKPNGIGTCGDSFIYSADVGGVQHRICGSEIEVGGGRGGASGIALLVP